MDSVNEMFLKAAAGLDRALLWQYPIALLATWTAGWLYDLLVGRLRRLAVQSVRDTGSQTVALPPTPGVETGGGRSNRIQNQDLPRFLLTQSSVILTRGSRNLCKALGCYLSLAWVAGVDESFLVVSLGPWLLAILLPLAWTGTGLLMWLVLMGLMVALGHGTGFQPVITRLCLIQSFINLYNMLVPLIAVVSVPLSCYLLLEWSGYGSVAATLQWYGILIGVHVLLGTLFTVCKDFVEQRRPGSGRLPVALQKTLAFFGAVWKTSGFTTPVLARFLALAS